MGVQETIHDTGAERARFREMKQGTAEDWAIIGGEYRAFAKGLPDRVLDHLRLLGVGGLHQIDAVLVVHLGRHAQRAPAHSHVAATLALSTQ